MIRRAASCSTRMAIRRNMARCSRASPGRRRSPWSCSVRPGRELGSASRTWRRGSAGPAPLTPSPRRAERNTGPLRPISSSRPALPWRSTSVPRVLPASASTANCHRPLPDRSPGASDSPVRALPAQRYSVRRARCSAPISSLVPMRRKSPARSISRSAARSSTRRRSSIRASRKSLPTPRLPISAMARWCCPPRGRS